MSEQDAEVWACAVCGPHPKSRASWCAAGCGRDYNQMTRLSDEDAKLFAAVEENE